MLHGARGDVDVGRTQQRQQRMVFAEHVQRKEAVTLVVPVEEFSQLISVNRIIGSVQIQHDSPGRRGMLNQERVRQKVVGRMNVRADLLVPVACVRSDRRQFQPVESALAGQRFAAIAIQLSVVSLRVCFPDDRRQQCVVAQPVVVVQIFVPEAQTEQPLLQQIDHRMLDLLGIPMIREAGGEHFDQTKPFFDLSQQDPPTIGAHPPAVKPGDDFAPTDLLKSERLSSTLCFHETASSVS